MIRRDDTSPDGSPAWILISQVEHARISAELAAAWGGTEVAPLPRPEIIVPAIRRHDDGWREWEQRPEIEPAHHRPYNFLEIPPITAHRLWSASIEEAADLGPLAQATIAGHFVELRRRHPGPNPAEAARFLGEYQPRIVAWRDQWRSESTANTAATADRALAALQFFDAWSLWLCCSAATTSSKLAFGDSFSVELVPRKETIAVRPWPFVSNRVALSAVGRSVPARQYRSADELANGPNSQVTISWQFAAGSAASSA